MKKHSAAVCAALFALSAPVCAKVTGQSTYNYFDIRGTSAKMIYSSLMAHAMGPGGSDAYATTKTNFAQKTTFTTKGGCAFANFDARLTFNISLPRAERDPLIPNHTVKAWGEFASMLKRHEEHHTVIWMGCANRLAANVRRMRAPNCSALTAQYQAAWNAMEQSCRGENQAFDRAEAARFPAQPFVRQVAGGQ